jgi:hypothetical protein
MTQASEPTHVKAGQVSSRPALTQQAAAAHEQLALIVTQPFHAYVS